MSGVPKGENMSYVFLILSVFMSATSSIFGKLFNKKNEGKSNSEIFYNFLLALSTCIGWAILYAISYSFESSVFWYIAMFSVCYTVCNFGIIQALKYGPATLTSLFVGLSLLVTTLWGFLFWNEQVTVYVAIGLIFVVVSIVLCLYSKKQDEKPFTWKWLFYVLLAFFGNAGCSIVQRTQQIKYNGQHGNMLMFFSTAISACIYLVLFIRSRKTDYKTMLRTSCALPVFAGICNVVLNVFVMKLALSDLTPSLIYPVIGVGGLAVVIVSSLLIFKEKMSLKQWIGVGVGAVAVVLLSI